MTGESRPDTPCRLPLVSLKERRQVGPPKCFALYWQRAELPDAFFLLSDTLPRYLLSNDRRLGLPDALDRVLTAPVGYLDKRLQMVEPP